MNEHQYPPRGYLRCGAICEVVDEQYVELAHQLLEESLRLTWEPWGPVPSWVIRDYTQQNLQGNGQFMLVMEACRPTEEIPYAEKKGKMAMDE